MKKLLPLILCLCLCTASYTVPAVAAEDTSLLERIECIAVILHSGGDTPTLENLLLIAVRKDNGKAVKVTFPPDLFPDENRTIDGTGARDQLLEFLSKKLQVPVEKYVSMGADALGSLNQGEAKDKNLGDLIGLGFSLLGSADTNLFIFDAIGTFQRVFAQKEEGSELYFSGNGQHQSSESQPGHWGEIRAEFLKSLEML